MRDKKLNGDWPMKCEPSQEAAAREEPKVHPVDCERIRKSRRKPELPESIRITAGQFVAIKRREHGWTQEELSWRSGMSRTQIGRIERDESTPTLKSIEMLESVLEIELYDLFMAQKRAPLKGSKERKKMRGSRSALGNFEKELARKGLTEEELKDLLSEALRSAESRLKNKKTE